MTQHYILKPVGQARKQKYCFTDCLPEGLKDKKLALNYGGTLEGIYPDDPFEVEMQLDEDSPKHIKIGSLVGTTHCYFMVDTATVEEIKRHEIGEVEFWPFTLVNHKGRVHSKDYSFVCPVHQFDALHDDSEISRDANGIVTRVRTIVLDEAKLADAPDLFRLNDTRRFVLSEKLVEILLRDHTNFAFEKAEQA